MSAYALSTERYAPDRYGIFHTTLRQAADICILYQLCRRNMSMMPSTNIEFINEVTHFTCCTMGMRSRLEFWRMDWQMRIQSSKDKAGRQGEAGL